MWLNVRILVQGDSTEEAVLFIKACKKGELAIT